MSWWNNRGYWGTTARENWATVVCSPGWWAYQCWQQHKNALFCVMDLQEDVQKDMSCALLLPTNMTAAEPFKSLNFYILGKLTWSSCVDICMNRMVVITGWLSGFTTQVEKVASEWEDQLLEVTNDSSLKSVFETTINLRMFWIKAVRISWDCHKSTESASISNILSLRSRVFCNDSSQNQIID